MQRAAKERILYGMQRYTGETERLVGILDNHLKDNEYLVGNKFSIADIASFGWINGLSFTGVDFGLFPNVKKWWARINARPAVQRGLSIPKKSPFGEEAFQQRLKDDPDFAKQHNELLALIQKGKDQYGYKYASP